MNKPPWALIFWAVIFFTSRHFYCSASVSVDFKPVRLGADVKKPWSRWHMLVPVEQGESEVHSDEFGTCSVLFRRSLAAFAFPQLSTGGGSHYLESSKKPVQLFIKIQGYGTLSTTRSAIASMTRALNMVEEKVPVEIFIDAVEATGCSPRSLPVNIRFLQRFGARLTNVNVVGTGPAIDAARACLFLGRCKRCRIFPNFLELSNSGCAQSFPEVIKATEEAKAQRHRSQMD